MGADEHDGAPDGGAEPETAGEEVWEPVAPEPVTAPEAPEPVVIADLPIAATAPSPGYQAELDRVRDGVAAELRRMKAAPAGTSPLEAAEQEAAPATVNERVAAATDSAARRSPVRRVFDILLIGCVATFMALLVGSGVYAAIRGDWKDVSYVIVAIVLFSGIFLEDRRRKRAKADRESSPFAEDAPPLAGLRGAVPGPRVSLGRAASKPGKAAAGDAGVRLRVLAALLSTVIPGAGLFVRRRVALGLFVLLGCLVLFCVPVALEMLGAPDDVVGWVGFIFWAAALILYLLGILWSALSTRALSEPYEAPKTVTLVVRRVTREPAAALLEVLLDGERIGTFGAKQVVSVPTAAGMHSLEVRVDTVEGVQSAKCRFTAQRGETVASECGYGPSPKGDEPHQPGPSGHGLWLTTPVRISGPDSGTGAGAYVAAGIAGEIIDGIPDT